jgi:hypothetical protein
MVDYNLSPQTQKTEFNMALASLERLNDELRRSNQMARLGDLPMWKASLDVIYREIAHYIKKEKPEIQHNYVETRKKVNNFLLRNNMQVLNARGFRKQNPEIQIAVQENSNLLYSVLQEWEILLRRVMDKYGLLIPNKESPDEAVLQSE